jgi:recombination protein RecA
MTLKEKLKSVAATVQSIEKQFGQGAVMTLGNAQQNADVPNFSSGSLGLDVALGVGGYPRGRLIEIYGPESSGKTTLSLHAIAEIQKGGGLAAFIDAEHALDIHYAKKLNVQAEYLLVSQPDHGEQALEIAIALIQSGGIELVVIDSVAALVPKAELDGEMEDHHVGLQARMMAKAMRKLTAMTHRTQSTIIFINQTRQKIGVAYGNPETTTGGTALKFFASVRLDVRKIGQIKDGETLIGNHTKVKVVKNKLAPPFREAEFEIRFGEGISRHAETLDVAVDRNVVDKSGAYYSYKGNRLACGRENTIAYLKEHPETASALETDIRGARMSAEKSATPKSDKEQAA